MVSIADDDLRRQGECIEQLRQAVVLTHILDPGHGPLDLNRTYGFDVEVTTEVLSISVSTSYPICLLTGTESS